MHIYMLHLTTYRVGKTQLLNRFVSGKAFKSSYVPTPGADFSGVRVILKDGTHAILQIWDYPGMDKNAKRRRQYYADSHVGIVVIDATRKKSLLKVGALIEQFLKANNSMPANGKGKHKQSKNNGDKDKDNDKVNEKEGVSTNAKLILLINKCEPYKMNRVEIDQKDIDTLKAKYGIQHHFETSASLGRNVKEALQATAELAASVDRNRAGIRSVRPVDEVKEEARQIMKEKEKREELQKREREEREEETRRAMEAARIADEEQREQRGEYALGASTISNVSKPMFPAIHSQNPDSGHLNSHHHRQPDSFAYGSKKNNVHSKVSELQPILNSAHSHLHSRDTNAGSEALLETTNGVDASGNKTTNDKVLADWVASQVAFDAHSCFLFLQRFKSFVSATDVTRPTNIDQSYSRQKQNKTADSNGLSSNPYINSLNGNQFGINHSNDDDTDSTSRYNNDNNDNNIDNNDNRHSSDTLATSRILQINATAPVAPADQSETVDVHNNSNDISDQPSPPTSHIDINEPLVSFANFQTLLLQFKQPAWNAISDRLFTVFDRSQSGLLGFGDFMKGIDVLCHGDIEARSEMLFDVLDYHNHPFIDTHSMITIAMFHQQQATRLNHEAKFIYDMYDVSDDEQEKEKQGNHKNQNISNTNNRNSKHNPQTTRSNTDVNLNTPLSPSSPSVPDSKNKRTLPFITRDAVIKVSWKLTLAHNAVQELQMEGESLSNIHTRLDPIIHRTVHKLFLGLGGYAFASRYTVNREEFVRGMIRQPSLLSVFSWQEMPEGPR